MFYKLWMKDKRVVFVPTSEIIIARSHDFASRLKLIQVKYPECVDWVMCEWEDMQTYKALEVATSEGWCSPE
jgi:hypothetical protein